MNFFETSPFEESHEIHQEDLHTKLSDLQLHLQQTVNSEALKKYFDTADKFEDSQEKQESVDTLLNLVRDKLIHVESQDLSLTTPNQNQRTLQDSVSYFDQLIEAYYDLPYENQQQDVYIELLKLAKAGIDTCGIKDLESRLSEQPSDTLEHEIGTLDLEKKKEYPVMSLDQIDKRIILMQNELDKRLSEE